MLFFQKIEIWYQKIKDYSFDCFKDENPTLWTNIQKCFLTLVHGFICDEYTSRAASLTYYTVTSIVPFMALMLGWLPKGGEEKAIKILEFLLPIKPESATRIFNTFSNYGNNPNVSWWVYLGTFAVMLWATYSLFFNLTHTLNDTIWKVDDRPLGRRIVFYVVTLAIVIATVWIANFVLNSINVWMFYAMAFVVSFLVYRLFPNVSYSKENITISGKPCFIKTKGPFFGALLFTGLLWGASSLATCFSGVIIESYIRNYGKTFYVVFVMLLWIWAVYVLFLSCAKIGWFIDNPKHNDIKQQDPIEEMILKVGNIAVRTFFEIKRKINNRK